MLSRLFVAYSIVNNSLKIEYDRSTRVLNTEWVSYMSHQLYIHIFTPNLQTLSNTHPSPALLSLTYILHINFSYSSSNLYNTHTTLFSLLSNYTAISTTLSVISSLMEEVPSTITASIVLHRQCGQKWPVDTGKSLHL